jgi:hypothetical protein
MAIPCACVARGSNAFAALWLPLAVLLRTPEQRVFGRGAGGTRFARSPAHGEERVNHLLTIPA